MCIQDPVIFRPVSENLGPLIHIACSQNMHLLDFYIQEYICGELIILDSLLWSHVPITALL